MPYRALSRVATAGLAAALSVFVVGCSGHEAEAPDAAHPAPTSSVVPADHAVKVQAFRDKHEADYRRDWVSIAGLHFLEPGSHTVGSSVKNDVVVVANLPATIGRITVKRTEMTFQPAPGVTVTQKDQPVQGPVVMKEESKAPGPEFTINDVRLVAHVSGDRLALRVRDANGPLAKDFRGFTWFPIDPEYRVVGKFTRDAQAKTVSVQNTLSDIDTYTTEGVLEFTLQGQTLHLRPFTSRPKRFYIVFRDASAGHETYETARFLYADLQDDGTAVLDFNEAYNPPCSFNPYTTCPIPLKENVLPVKILAGEKAYPIHVSIPEPTK
jgi:uncharacterized protein